MSACFQKSQRLLNSSEYKQVFDHNQFRVSNQHLLILAYYPQTHAQTSRLGLVISKKNVARAVDRNRVKRITRETFRQNSDFALLGLDIIVLARKGLASQKNAQLQSTLTAFFSKLEKKHNAHKKTNDSSRP